MGTPMHCETLGSALNALCLFSHVGHGENPQSYLSNTVSAVMKRPSLPAPCPAQPQKGTVPTSASTQGACAPSTSSGHFCLLCPPVVGA